MKVGLALGANLGDRLRHLQEARSHLQTFSYGGWLLSSPLYETAPVNCPPDSPAFLNAVIEIDYDDCARSLLNHIHDYEAAQGRDRTAEKNAPRPIDIDILYFGGQEIHEADLIVPHPRLAGRRFVLLPLSTIRPELEIKSTGKTVAKLLSELPGGGESVTVIQQELVTIMNDHKTTLHNLREMKQRGEKIAVLTVYDFFTAKIMDEVGLQMLLVGDSLGMAVLGYENTLPVTMEEMLHHTRAVARAKPKALVVGDMPFMTYSTVEQALTNAGRMIQAGAEAVKVEGGEPVIEQVRALVAAGIPVLGHIGLLPQSILETGGYKIQGRTPVTAERLLHDAKLLEQAGVFAIVIECTVADVSRKISESISIPTIGIGAGPGCDGQVLVSNDMLGLFTWFTPKHVKRYANLSEEMRKAFAAYKKDVESGKFPDPDHSF